MSKGVIEIYVTIVVALVAVVSIVIGLVIYVGAVIAVSIFNMGGVEVVNVINTPYVIGNILEKYDVDGKPLMQIILESSITGKIDQPTLEKISLKIHEILDMYSFAYEISLEGTNVTAACSKLYDSKHKAVDISVSCGTPVKAVCGGKLAVIGPGLSGDPVFGGTSGGGQEGLAVDHDNKCFLTGYNGYRSLYGCVDIPIRTTRTVIKGETIGYASTCGAEKDAGCHLHFSITKGSISDEEDPKICNNLESVVDQGVNMLASKGQLDADKTTEAPIPLFFKGKIKKLVVRISER